MYQESSQQKKNYVFVWQFCLYSIAILMNIRVPLYHTPHAKDTMNVYYEGSLYDFDQNQTGETIVLKTNTYY